MVLWPRWSVACRVKKSRVSEATALSIRRMGPLILPQVPELCGPYRSGRSHVEKSSTWYSDSCRRRKAARHGNEVQVVTVSTQLEVRMLSLALQGQLFQDHLGSAPSLRDANVALFPRQVQPPQALCATCRDIVGLRRAPWPTHRRFGRSLCAPQLCAGTSGNIAFFSPLLFPFPESVPMASVPIQWIIP